MFNIAICDDSSNVLYSMKKYISAYCTKRGIEFQINAYPTGDNFLLNFQVNKFSMIFLDIEMGDGANGLEVAQNIWLVDKHVAIVFVTGHEEYVYEALKIHPFHFLIKPILEEKIEEIITDYFNLFEEQESNVNYKMLNVRMQSICYVEKFSDKLIVVTDYERENTYGTLKQLIRHLDESFIQCHRGFIVNMNKIIRLDLRSKGNELQILGCDFPIPIGGIYQDSFLKAYAKHQRRHWRYKS